MVDEPPPVDTATEGRPAGGAPRVSVAIPLYNEEEVLSELLRRVGTVLDQLPGGPHEVVLVDDGSSDRTLEMLQDAAARDPRLVVVELSRNFGHQMAVTAGLDHASGDVVVVMDGDLQDLPEAIPDLLAAHRAGADVVYARRVGRKEGLVLRASYALFYRLAARLSSIQLPLDAGDFALLDRRVVDEIRALPEYHRYVRGLRAWVGFRQVGIDVERSARAAGSSKYSLGRLLRLALDGLLAFSVAPLRAASLLGLGAMAVSLAYAAWAVVAKVLLSRSPQGFTALIVAIVFLAGVQLMFLGVLGEYVGRIYEEAKRRPSYIVRRVLRSG
jgi:dolichol-phosphate mannosyltransferase